jgi:hypothetical protein
MKRTTKLLAAVVMVVATATGVAAAASSPTVATGAAISVGNFGATLTGTVNPNGNATSYVFQYGITSAYGVSTHSHSAGSGLKAVTATTSIKGLTPGTVYHYRLTALNKAGAGVGVDRKFRTTGPPPALVATGSPVNVGKSAATVTGSVTTNGAPTTWAVQYGLTTSYGVQTFGQVAQNSSSPVPVSVALSGLAPATLFHYRLVGYHSGSVASYGSDGTFFTEPLRRPRPRLALHTAPSTARHRPFAFTTVGTVTGGGFIPATSRCFGNVGLRYYAAGRQIGFIVAPVGSNCQFSAHATFNHVAGQGPTPVRIRTDFRGNGYIAPASRTTFVTVR